MVNLRYLNQFISYQYFRMESFGLPLQITARGRLHVQPGYEGCLFLSSTVSVIKKLCSVFMVRESLQLPLFMFWLGTSSQNLHIIVENTSVCVLRGVNIWLVMTRDNKSAS